MMDCISESSVTDIEFELISDLQVVASGATVSSSTGSVDPDLATIDFDPFVDGELSLTAPATESQQEIWLGVQLSNEANLACLLSQSLRSIGRLNLDALQAALSALVSRHESLRTTFSGDGTTILINKASDLQFPIIECLGAIDREQELKKYQSLAVSIPFDLTHGSLFTAQIIRFDDCDHALILTVHHIICDGWSLGILGADLARLYTAIARSVAPDLEPPAYFSEYAFLEQKKFNRLPNIDDRLLIDENNLATIARSEIEAYWLQKFADLPPVVELPTDYTRPPLRTFNAAHEDYQLPASLVRSIEQLGIANGCSLMTTLLAAFEVFLSKITDRTELVVGVPTSGQIAAGKNNLVGHCVNFLPCRSRIDPRLTFTEYLRSRNSQILDDYEHQDFTFGSLLKKLAIARDASRMPLISAVFNIDLNADDNPGRFDRLTVDTVVNHSAFATFEFFLNAATTSNGQLNLDCQYNTKLFSAATIQRRLAEFENILHQIIEPVTRPISQLSLLSLSAEYQLLVTWNDTKTDYPRTQCIHQLFEQRVKIAGEAIALVYQQHQLTYRELNDRSNQLANYLLGLGVQRGQLIGIAMPRSLDTIVAILGILKAGCAYIPLDLTYPLQRLSFMLEDAKASILVTTTAALTRLPPHPARFVHLDTDWDEIATASTTNPQVLVDSTSLAYVMYTSGSTGQPKGVCVPHQGVVRLVTATNYIDFSPQQVFLQLAPIAFDAATFEIWGSLLNGAKLVLFPGEKPSLAELGQTIQQHQITTLWLTAGLFHLIVDERLADLQPLRQLIAGGDVLSVPHVQKLLSTLTNCQLINGYGPTENTTFTCCYPIANPDTLLTSVPIGRPIANTQVYILNPDRQPVPIGIPGELYIGGDGLAQGYLDRPELTSEKFIPNPFSTGKLYQTGDLARYLPDGNIEFLGRIDNQVKIRGFRVELGEIEAAISAHPSVREVRVIDAPPPGARPSEERGDKRLVAYIVPTAPDEARTLSHRDLRTFLQSRLPDYAIPSAVVMVAAFPLTPNGKVDRRALPLPDDDRRDDTTKVSPRDELELQLTKIWERLLGIESIGIRDNFFELGGHSLIAVRLFAEIDRIWGRNLPLATLFQAQTIEELASVIRQQEWTDPWSSLVLMQPGGSKPPIFCIHPIGGNILEYYALAHDLGREHPIYGLQSQGLDGKQQPLDRVEDMASHYIREIRAVQPHGPYFLIGYSFGGLVAFEIACQLHSDNEKVELLALLDCSSPNLSKLRPSFIQSLRIHLCNLWQLSSQEKIDYIMDRILYRFNNDNERDFLIKSLYKPQDLTPPLLNILNANLQARENYVARSYLGKLTLFRCQVQDLEHYTHSELGWSHLVGTNLDIYHVPEVHFKIMKEPTIGAIAEKIKSCL